MGNSTDEDHVSEVGDINEITSEDEREEEAYDAFNTAIDIETAETEDAMEPLDMVGLEVPVVDLHDENTMDLNMMMKKTS